MNRREKFKKWWKRCWRMVVIGVLAAALIVSVAILVPRLHRVTAELNNAKTELATVNGELTKANDELTKTKEELTKTKGELAETGENLTKANEEIEVLEEQIEALVPTTTKAEVEDVLVSVWKAGVCRADVETALRNEFSNLRIEWLSFNPKKPEESSGYIMVRVKEGGFYIQGTSLYPLIKVG